MWIVFKKLNYSESKEIAAVKENNFFTQIRHDIDVLLHVKHDFCEENINTALLIYIDVLVVQFLSIYIEIITELLENEDVNDDKSVDDGDDVEDELVVSSGRNDMLLRIQVFRRFCWFPNRLSVSCLETQWKLTLIVNSSEKTRFYWCKLLKEFWEG